MPTFDADDAIRLGGWNPTHARVLVATSDGFVAAALVDTNGDGRHVDLSVYRRSAGTWVVALEYTDIGNRMAKAGEVAIEGGPDRDTEAYVISWGRAQPSTETCVEVEGHHATAMANAVGRWMVALPAHSNG